MHAVENCIKNHGHNFECCFVFPNSISQRITFRKALDITGEATLPSELYLSWNMFIKEHIKKEESEKAEEVESATRQLYAQYVIARHAKAPLFKELIPKNCNTRLFACWLASILPELQAFLYAKTSGDDELADLHLLAKDYSAFLKENSLYEPGWEQLHINPRDDKKRYIIIYPELIDDFARYEGQLREAKNVDFLHVRSSTESVKRPLYEAENTRLELKYVMSQIEELLLKGVALSEIALSVVDIEKLQAYILAEAELRDIPIDFYVQTALIDDRFCSIFQKIQEVYSTHYSFEAIKKLLLNKAIPWKFESKIDSLLKFGVEHSCSVSWQEKGKWHNVWEEAFDLLEVCSTEEKESKELFSLLKDKIDAICKAKNFEDVASCIDEFMQTCIGKEQIDDRQAQEECQENIQKNLQAISKYRKILKDLIKTEKGFQKYLDEAKINRYDFFVAVLEKEMIHSEVSGQGVSIFPYGAAASIPFKHHFVINLNQQDASIVRGKLKFLRDDKRDRMNIWDVDLTSYFIKSYLEAENVQFSYSKKTYQKYAIAHSFFDELLPITSCAGCYQDSYHKADSFYREECFYLEVLAFSNSEPLASSTLAKRAIASIGNIYKMQKEGMEGAEHFDKENTFSILRESCGSRIPELSEAIENSLMKEGQIIANQSDLYTFFLKCPIKFLFEKLLKLEKQTLSFSNMKSKLIDKLDIGTLYHKILERVYRRILATSGGKFDKNCLADGTSNEDNSYKTIAKKVLESILKERNSSPLVSLFVHSMQVQMERAIEGVFALDAEYFDGYEIYAIEENLEVSSTDGILYKGKIDRAMRKDKNIVLLDYKTGFSIPECRIKDGKLTDFQMPFYVFLLENERVNKSNSKDDPKNNSSQTSTIEAEDSKEELSVETALFVKLRKGEASYVFRSENKRENEEKGKTKESRKDFEEQINLLKEEAKIFKNCLTCADFAPSKDIWKNCIDCEYKHICRTTFFVKKQFVGKR